VDSLRRLITLTVAAGAVGLAPLAAADGPVVEMQVKRNGILAWNDFPVGSPNGDGSFDYAGNYADASGWEIHGLGGPGTDYGCTMLDHSQLLGGFASTFLGFGFTNNTGVTDTFTVTVSMNLSGSVIPGTMMSGDVEGTLSDSDFSGLANVTNTGPKAGYNGLIDGNIELELLDPFSENAGFGQTVPIGPEAAALVAGPAAISTIGIIIPKSHNPTTIIVPTQPRDRASTTIKPGHNHGW
jgi:hypothetical protein